MKFKIENGTNHIAIDSCEIGSYFRFDNPLSLAWEYDGGTVGKYYCVLPSPPEVRRELHSKLVTNLNNDFSGRTEELYHLLEPLFSLFKNGEYSLEYYGKDDKTFFAFKTSADNYEALHYIPLGIVFAETTDAGRTEMTKKRYHDFVKENEISKKYAPLISSTLRHPGFMMGIAVFLPPSQKRILTWNA